MREALKNKWVRVVLIFVATLIALKLLSGLFDLLPIVLSAILIYLIFKNDQPPST